MIYLISSGTAGGVFDWEGEAFGWISSLVGVDLYAFLPDEPPLLDDDYFLRTVAWSLRD